MDEMLNCPILIIRTISTNRSTSFPWFDPAIVPFMLWPAFTVFKEKQWFLLVKIKSTIRISSLPKKANKQCREHWEKHWISFHGISLFLHGIRWWQWSIIKQLISIPTLEYFQKKNNYGHTYLFLSLIHPYSQFPNRVSLKMYDNTTTWILVA